MESNSPEPATRGRLFDGVAETYRDARPGYPVALFDLLAEICHLSPGSRVLEIGAGAGQATMPMLERGVHVTAIEPGVSLADVLRRRGSGLPLEVIVSTFEDARIAERSFDLAVSATAFHWIDPDLGLAKVGRALRGGGWLALWWTIFADSTRADPFHDALEPILLARAPHLVDEGSMGSAYGLDTVARISEIERSGSFGPVQTHILSWEGRHTPDELRALFSTYSPWLALPDDLREQLLDVIAEIARKEFDGLVVRPYQTVLYLAMRCDR